MRAADPVRHLPWLAPSAPALAAIASAKHPWQEPVVRNDAGAIALLLRFQKNIDKPILEINSSERAELLRFAIKRLRSQPVGFVENSGSACSSLRVAHLAERLSIPENAARTRVIGTLTGLVPFYSPPSMGGEPETLKTWTSLSVSPAGGAYRLGAFLPCPHSITPPPSPNYLALIAILSPPSAPPPG